MFFFLRNFSNIFFITFINFIIKNTYFIISDIFVETNCENMESRFLKDVYFKDNMGKGEYITLDKKSDWMIFKSDSLGDKFNKFVCLQ